MKNLILVAVWGLSVNHGFTNIKYILILKLFELDSRKKIFGVVMTSPESRGSSNFFLSKLTPDIAEPDIKTPCKIPHPLLKIS